MELLGALGLVLMIPFYSVMWWIMDGEFVWHGWQTRSLIVIACVVLLIGVVAVIGEKFLRRLDESVEDKLLDQE